jgi:hypothetical protein
MRVDFTYVKNGRVCHESDVCDSVTEAVEAFEARTAVRSYRVSVDDSDEQYDEEMLAEERGFKATMVVLMGLIVAAVVFVAVQAIGGIYV